MMTKWLINLLSFLCGYLDILLLILFIQQVLYQVVEQSVIFFDKLIEFGILICFWKIFFDRGEEGWIISLTLLLLFRIKNLKNLRKFDLFQKITIIECLDDVGRFKIDR